MKLVVGLGNPGPRYIETRHNVGFHAVDFLANSLDIKVDRPFMRALVGQQLYHGEKIVLAKPQTYMNLSGESVSGLMRWFKLDSNDLIVIYDDLDLAPGRLRIRNRGGSGGHNGLASIINRLGTGDFTRLRLGIGRPQESGMDVVNWVLGRPAPGEREAIDRVLQKVPDIISEIIRQGVESAMNKYNGKNLV